MTSIKLHIKLLQGLLCWSFNFLTLLGLLVYPVDNNFYKIIHILHFVVIQLDVKSDSTLKL